MTVDELKKIKTDLDKWKKERHLSIVSQRVGLVGNLAEELTEFYRARTDEERVDALCDMIVFSLNAMSDIQANMWISILHRGIFDMCKGKPYKHLSEFSEYFTALYDLPTLEYLDQETKEKHYNKALIQICNHCSFSLASMGYNDYLCMTETIKEISSRTGSYDKSLGKWVKDLSKKDKWIKADYAKCRV